MNASQTQYEWQLLEHRFNGHPLYRHMRTGQLAVEEVGSDCLRALTDVEVAHFLASTVERGAEIVSEREFWGREAARG